MRKLSAIVLLVVAALVLSVLALPAAAQDEGGPGEGGIIIESNFGGDIATLNPIIISDASSSAVAGFLYPSIIGLDPETQNAAPNVAGALATGWEYDETGTVLTIHLRDDAFWNDGTPITSADYLYAAEAIKSGETDSARTYVFDSIESIEAPDDYTVVVTFKEFNCRSFNDVNDIPVVPAHIFSEVFETYADMNEDVDYNLNPTVTFGPFAFGEYRPAEQVSLVADQSYPDTILGYVSPAGWIYKNVADQTVEIELLLAGEINVVAGVTPERQQDMRDNPDIQTFDYPANSYTYMGFNLADPTNPQNGLDEEGNPIDQGHHPLFGDVRVRQAIAMGVDVASMVDATLFGEGVQIATNAIPTSWAYDDSIEPWPFDPDAASALLEEAGWIDEDGDGVRECHGCLYAEEGTPAEFELLTNAGNTTRERIGEIIQSQLADLGIKVNFNAIDFNILVQTLLGQEFDAIIIGWSLGLPDDPDGTSFYGPENDLVGSGFNFVSMNNEELNRLYEEAAHVEGCDQDARAELYIEANRLLRNELPYLYLYSANAQYAVRAEIEGFDPFPSFLYWNIDAWSVISAE